MQGPSELGISQDAKLARWSRFDDLSSIEVPALVIGARYDTMDPAHMEQMASGSRSGRYLYCPEGSHLAMYDDQRTYFSGLVDFLHEPLKASGSATACRPAHPSSLHRGTSSPVLLLCLRTRSASQPLAPADRQGLRRVPCVGRNAGITFRCQ